MDTPKRTYTTAELYEMRTILLDTLPIVPVSEDRGIIALLVEVRLLTCLLNGTTLEDLWASRAKARVDLDL